MGRYLRRRLADLFLMVAWLVVLFQIIQIARIRGDSSTQMWLSYAAVLAIGAAVTVLWWRARRRT